MSTINPGPLRFGGWVANNNGPDDVASNEKLETEQNRAAHILPVKGIIIASVVLNDSCESHGGNHLPTATMNTPTPSTLVRPLP